jgi:environmental stress-induced protein Ves
MKKLSNKHYKISDWSGGKTKELFIYPENSDYKEKNFDWRISSASVEIEESIFTKLPGINRIIMPLKGVLSLNHLQHRKVKLNEFEQDRFRGDWTTKSKGEVIDFNVMFTDDFDASLVYKSLNSQQSLVFEAATDADIFIYCISGNIQISEITITTDEALYLTKSSMNKFNINATDNSQILITLVTRKNG